MLETLVNITWKKLPYQARLRVVRLTQKKFTASVVGIITNEEGQVLVLDHLIRPGSTWGLPGGFLEPDENPEDGIQRELFEETGLRLKTVNLIRIRTIRKHIEILFRAEGVGEAVVKSREIKSLGWFALDEFPPEMSKIQKKLVREILSD
jgi:ADP-ribose pyrophosphatase YjhB (NUDIX family)